MVGFDVRLVKYLSTWRAAAAVLLVIGNVVPSCNRNKNCETRNSDRIYRVEGSVSLKQTLDIKLQASVIEKRVANGQRKPGNSLSWLQVTKPLCPVGADINPTDVLHMHWPATLTS